MNEYFLIKQRNMEEELACVDETAPIWKYYQQEEDAIMDICMENFITCFLLYVEFHIRSKDDVDFIKVIREIAERIIKLKNSL